MADYDLYGIDAATPNDAAKLIVALLPLLLHPQNSSYIGSYILADGKGDETFKLLDNIDPNYDEPAEAGHISHNLTRNVSEDGRGSGLR